MTELYELRKLFMEYGDEVRAWASGREAITRENVAALRSALKGAKVEDGSAAITNAPTPEVSLELASTSSPMKDERASFDAPASAEKPPSVKTVPRSKATRLAVELRGHPFELVVDKDPGRRGEVLVRPLQGGAHKTVSAADVRLIGFVEG